MRNATDPIPLVWQGERRRLDKENDTDRPPGLEVIVRNMQVTSIGTLERVRATRRRRRCDQKGFRGWC